MSLASIGRAKRLLVRAAGIDYGSVRIGVAVADELGLLAHPRSCLSGRNPGRMVDALADLAREEGIDLFVVGLPRTLDGREGTSARRVRKFAALLRARSGCRVLLFDERWSTKDAHARLMQAGHRTPERRARVDSAAAALLLQAYLDGTAREAT